MPMRVAQQVAAMLTCKDRPTISARSASNTAISRNASAMEPLAGVAGAHRVRAGREDVGRQRADALLDRLALRVGHGPLRVGNGIAAGACNELERDLGDGMGKRRLGELARLDGDVGAD